MKNSTTTLTKVALAGALLLPAFAFAQVSNEVMQMAAVGATAQAQVTPTSAQVNVRAKVMASSTADTTRAARAKDKAAQEIDRRIAALNDLMLRVQAMNKVTDTLKTNLKSNVQLEIDGFTALKAKIEADTDLATLKTDIKSVTDSYRIFMLVIPQGRISAAADRMATVINMMAAMGAKLQARITSAKTAGADTTAMEAALASLGTKLGSAQAHAQESINVTAPLVPDNGDKTVMASNNAALKKAVDEIKAGQADIAAGRKDIETIIKGLKASASASTTVSGGAGQL
jgi:hypothetical protein